MQFNQPKLNRRLTTASETSVLIRAAQSKSNCLTTLNIVVAS